MTLEDKLIELDQWILSKYEKVTQAVHKELGWNKYDLARRCAMGEALSFGGAGIYVLMMEFKSGSLKFPTLGSLALAASPFFYVMDARDATKMEETEISTVMKTGAGISPKMSPLRPLNVPVGLGFVGMGIYNVQRAYTSSQNPDIATLIGLGLTAMGLYALSDVSRRYFMDTTFHPPSAKKSLRNWAYDKITGKLPAPAVPEEVKQNTCAG